MKILSKITVVAAVVAVLFSTASAATALTYTGTLQYGSRGASVSALQSCLNAEGKNAGIVDGIFGMTTKSAVMSFQSSNNLTVDGVAGPMTHSKLDCSMGGTVVPDDNDDDNSPVDLEDFIIEGGREGSVEDFEAKDGDDNSVVEGDSNMNVAHFEFVAEDSDLLLERIDFVVTGADNNDEVVDADGIFEDVTLVVNGDEVDTIDASDSDEWDDDKYGIRDDYDYMDEPTEEVMSLRFAGINKILEEGDKVTIELEATIPDSVDGSDDGENWDIYIPQDGLRLLDTSGSTLYSGDDTDSASLTIEGEGADNAFDIKTSTGNPDAQTVEVDDTNRTTFMALEFKIEADENGEDLQINSLAVEATTGVEDYSDIVYETTLEIDGEEYDVDTIDILDASECDTSGAYAEGTTTPCLVWDFDRNEVVVEAGDTVTAKLWVEVNDLDGIAYDPGETLSFDIQGEDADVEGDDSKEDVTDLGGAVTGETQTLYVDGIMAELGTVTYSQVTDQSGAITSVDFFMPLEISAFGDTFFIPEDVETSSGATVGTVFSLELSGATTTGTANGVISTSTADIEVSGVNWYRIDEGDTETLTVKVTVPWDGTATPAIGNVRVQLDELYTALTAGGALSLFELLPSNEFESQFRSITY